MIPLQKKLFEMEVHLSDMKRGAVGTAGEIMARLMLERSGYVVVTTGRGTQRGDLLAIVPATGESWRVEVKTARRSKTGVWKFCLVKDGKTDCKDADVVLLLAILASGQAVPFVVPVEAIGELRSIQFHDPRCYAGKWAAFRQGRILRLEAAANDRH